MSATNTYYPADPKSDLQNLDLDFEDIPVDPKFLELRRQLELQARQTRFFRVAMFWHRLGYPVCPGRRTDKVPLVDGWTDWSDGKPQTEEELLQLAINHPDATPLLLTASGPFRFVVVDVDDPAHLQWALDTFGHTPLVVATGREGGGYHLYYLIPAGVDVPQANGMVGPDESVQSWAYQITPEGKVRKASKSRGDGASWGRTTIDIKGNHAYVVAPGAVHRTGLVYRPMGMKLSEITLEWIQTNVPVFPVDVFEREKERAFRRRDEHDAEIQAKLPKNSPSLIPTKVVDGVTYSAGDEEPFFRWCEINAPEVTRELWFGLASNLAAVHGAAGAAEFHRLSACDPGRYDLHATQKQWDYALRWVQAGKPPTSYQRLRMHGYRGPVPQVGKSPAAFLLRAPTGVFGLDGQVHEVAPEKPQETEDERITREVEELTRDLPQRDQFPEEAREQKPRSLPAKKPRKRKPLGPGVEQVAAKALDAAKAYATILRRHWRTGGFDFRGGCRSLHHGLGSTATGGQIIISRKCRKITCIVCGPMQVALKLASILHMPLLDEHGTAIGLPMGSRELFVHEVSKSGFSAWKKMFERKSKPKTEDVADCTDLKGESAICDIDSLAVPAYVAFTDGGAKYIILSTLNLGGDRVDPGQLETSLLVLGSWAYQPKLDDVAGMVWESRGKASSSRGICLDPEALRRAALENPWVLEETDVVPPSEALHRAREEKFPVNITEIDFDTKLPTSISMPAPETDQERRRRWEALKRERPKVVPPVNDVDEAAIEAVIHELLG